MNTPKSRMITILGMVSCQLALGASEFRSPLILERGVPFYPYKAQDDGLWVVNAWDALYGRSADEAFMPSDVCDCQASTCSKLSCGALCPTSNSSDCTTGGSTRHTESLSALLFGKSVFRAEEAFYGGQLDTDQMAKGNPYVSFAYISPSLEYTEKGLMCGIGIHRKFGDDCRWRVGARASWPFKIIEVKRRANCKLAESLEDVMTVGTPLVCPDEGSGGLPVFAYRLDFLSSLGVPTASSCGANHNGVITWGNGVDACPATTGITKITCIDITNVEGNVPPVLAEYNPSCCPPAMPPTSTMMSGTLGAGGRTTDEGAALASQGLYQFGFPNVNYAAGLAKDRQAQSKLWIVPNLTVTDGTARAEANAIHENIQMILNTLDYQNKDSAERFLNQQGIFFNDRRVTGVGDLFTQLYAGYHPDEEFWYDDMIFCLKIPTATKLNDPAETLYMTTGNNGHVEVSLANETGWQPKSWLALRMYLQGTHVCNHTEKRAVRFKGSTIRNIGPAIDVAVSYNYVEASFEFNFYHPEYTRLGCSVGYDLYARGKDTVCCSSPACPVDNGSCGCVSPTTKIVNGKATDLLGFLRTIDCSLNTCDTKTMTHTLRGDLFYRFCSGYLDLFGGGSYVIAGRYAMKESEAHVGVAVNF